MFAVVEIYSDLIKAKLGNAPALAVPSMTTLLCCTFMEVGLGVDPFWHQIPMNEVFVVCEVPRATILLVMVIILVPDLTEMPVTIGGVSAVVPMVELRKSQILLPFIVVPNAVVTVLLAREMPLTMIFVVAVVLVLAMLLIVLLEMVHP